MNVLTSWLQLNLALKPLQGIKDCNKESRLVDDMVRIQNFPFYQANSWITVDLQLKIHHPESGNDKLDIDNSKIDLIHRILWFLPGTQMSNKTFYTKLNKNLTLSVCVRLSQFLQSKYLENFCENSGWQDPARLQPRATQWPRTRAQHQ